MKILYIHQYFVTPEEPGGTRSYWIAKELINRGFRVTMITSDTTGKFNETRRKSVDGIDVIYIPNSYNNNMGLTKRLWSFLTFMILSTRFALKEKDIHLVFATSTPLTIGIPALIKRWLHKTPYIFEVRDLWPEVPIQLGALKNKILIKLAVFLEKTIYLNASHVIALSPGMEKGVLRFDFMKGKTSMIPNMSKPDIFFPRNKDLTVAKEYNIDPTKFNVVHFGSMGVANGLEYITHAALIVGKKSPDIIFHFFGSGKTEEILKSFCEINNLQNVLFHGALPMEILSECVNLCDVSLVSFLNIPILQTNSPNKLFDSLSAGLPIIVNSAGWTKDMVEHENCGFFVDPRHPRDLVEKLNFLRNDDELQKKYSKNSRRLALDSFNKDILCDKIAIICSNFCLKV